MARFEEVINIQTQGISTGAAPGLMSLSQRLEAFHATQRQITSGLISVAGRRAEQRGIQTGQEVPIEREEGITKKPEFKERKFIGGIEIDAHNRALRAAYIASIGNDIRNEVGRIQAENPDNLINYNEAVGSFAKGLINGVDPSVRSLVIADLDDRITTGRVHVQAADIKKQNDIANEEINTSIDSAVEDALRNARNGDNLESGKSMVDAFSMIDASVNAKLRTDKEAVEIKREINKRITEQSIKGGLDRLAETSIPEAFKELDRISKKVLEGWTPDEWQEFIGSSQQELNRKESRLRKQVVELTKQQLMVESVDRGMSFTNPNIPADPTKSSQDRKDVNNAYDAIAPTWNELPPGEQFGKHVDFVKNTGIMPDRLITGINATMRSGNPDQVNVFAGLINEISQDPNAANILRDVPAESRAISKQVSDSIDSGIDVETAVEIARKNTFGLTETEKERIKLETQAIRQELPEILDDMIESDDEFDVFIFEPDVSPALQADFNVVFDKFMVLTNGDSKQSAELAFGSIKKTWSMTKIAGPKRFMKYAPEVFYSVPGVSNKWMRKQFKSDMKGASFDVGDLTIAVDFETANSTEPTWMIMTVDKNNIAVPLHDVAGNVLRWKPDFTVTKDYQKLKEKPGRKLDQAIDIKKRVNKLNEIIGIKPKLERLGDI